MMSSNEEWKPVVQFPDRYKVSNCGNVYSLKSNHVLKSFLKCVDSSKQVCIVFNVNHRSYEREIKRIVYEAFVEKLLPTDVVINKDNDPFNNCLDNLEKVSSSDIQNKRYFHKYAAVDGKEHYVRYLNKYRVIYRPDHFHHNLGKDYEGWVFEHRYVVECHLGRALKSDEIVHHKDGNIYNNDISNLQVVSRSEHAHIHYGTSLKSYCIDCGKEITFGSTRCLDCHLKYLAKKRKPHPDKYELLKEVKNSNYTKVARKYDVSTTTIENWLEDLYQPKRRKQVSL